MTAPIVSPTFTADALTTSELNTAFSTLTTAINALIGAVDALSAPSAPDLSGYATDSDLSTHVAAADAHRAMVKMLTSVIPSGKQATLQYVQVTLSAGTATATWPTAYTGGAVLKAWALDTTAANAVRVHTLTTTQGTVVGTGSDVIDVFVIGYL